jgi:Domain of unknown function (DUF4340)
MSAARAGNTVTPIALVVLAVGTAAYAYVVDRERVSDADRQSRSADVFPSFRVDDVRRIELEHGSEKLVLDRPPAGASAPQASASSGSGWAMTSPRPDATDPAAIDVLLRELDLARRVRDVQAADARGLDAPRVRGTVAVGPVEYRFALGSDAATPDGAAYMRVEGEGTFVVGRALKVQLLRGADAYRDRTLVPYGASDVARVELRAPVGGVVVLERHGTAFRVGGTNGLRASRAAVDHLFEALADARAESFVDDGAADRAVGPRARAVVLIPRDPARPRMTLLVGGTCPSADPTLVDDVVVVRLEPTRTSACAARGLVEALGVTAEALVDEAPFIAHADEIEELRIESRDAAGLRVDLARRGNGWHERAPEDRDLDADEVDSANGLAASLTGARALDARPSAPGERLAMIARTTIVRTGGASPEVVEIEAPDVGGVSLARRADDASVLRLPREAARRFEPHPIAIERRTLWRAPIDPGEVTAIDDSCSRSPQRLELDDGVWTARGFAVDNLSASGLAESFARAKADAWIAETDDGTFGFGRPGSCSVTLTLDQAGDAGARRVGIVFGDEAEGGLYARAADGRAVFLAPRSLRELAARPSIDRGRFRLDIASLVRVVVERNGARVVLSRPRGADRLVRAGAELDGGEASDEADRGRGLERGLAGLYAEAAVHAGPPDADEGMDRPTLAIDATSRRGPEGPVETRISIGAPERGGTTDAYFARVSGVDATFAVPRSAVSAILDAL